MKVKTYKRRKKIITIQLTLQGMLKEVLYVNGKWQQMKLNLLKGMKSMGKGNHIGKQIHFFHCLNNFHCLKLFFCSVFYSQRTWCTKLSLFSLTFHTPTSFLPPGPYLPCHLPLPVVFSLTGIPCLYSLLPWT